MGWEVYEKDTNHFLSCHTDNTDNCAGVDGNNCAPYPFSPPPPSPPSPSLYFSMYMEGSWSKKNRAIQLYNPSCGSLDLSRFSILQTKDDGKTTSIPLSGNISPKSVYTICHHQ